jgi:hypothetical protein
MSKYVYSAESGDDRNDGLTPDTPVRSGQRAIKVSLATGREILVLDFPDARPKDELELPRKKQEMAHAVRKIPAAA